jgi:NAD(P)-dependent dehydrogenase (short-subunit alcohol dehydrogenase family)
MQVQGGIALVTGASRGIGKALVTALVARGAATVYAAARRRADVEALAATAPGTIVPIQLDVTKASDLAAAAAKATDLTLLFNNAGVLEVGSVLDASPEAFKSSFDVNTFGLLNTTRAFAPALAANGGGLVNVLTVVALASMPGLGVYNASKAAALSLTQSLRGDFAKKGVKVFSVFPGPVDTDMARSIELPKTSPDVVAAEILDAIAADREDIFPDPTSKQLYENWSKDHKAVERQFAAM